MGEPAVERPYGNADTVQVRGDRCIDDDLGLHIATMPEGLAGVGLGCDMTEEIGRGTLEQMQRNADSPKIGGEARQRVMQPPFGGVAERAEAGAGFVEHVECEDRSPRSDGSLESRMIRQAQIVTEPEERGRLTRRSAGHQESGVGGARGGAPMGRVDPIKAASFRSTALRHGGKQGHDR